MRNLLVYIFIIFISCNHKRMTNEELHSKGRSAIIIKDGSFLEVQLNVRPLSKDKIFVDFFITNSSDDSILFYNALLPLNGELKTNIFSIFDNESLDEINYSGTINEQYLNSGTDIIIPKLKPINFTTLLPRQTKSYAINISKFYDFSKIDVNKSLSLTYVNILPAVAFDYRQVYERDSIDNILKPVYYEVSLPQNQIIDSMRVKFFIK